MGKKRNEKPSIQSSEVPSLENICDALGFRKTKDADAFKKVTRKWCKSYTTAGDVRGSALVDWNLQETQNSLATMSKTFLREAGHGNIYWSYIDGPNNELYFPHDEDRLINLLNQFFWKQNYYAASHKKYGRKTSARDRFRYMTLEPSSLVPPKSTAPRIPVRSVANRQSIVGAVIVESAHLPKVPDSKNSERITSAGPSRPTRPETRHSSQRQPPAALSSVPTPPVVSNRIPSKDSPLMTFSLLPANISTQVAPLAKASFSVPFYICQNEGGVTRRTFWKNGRFGKKTLEEFLDELAEKQKCQPEDIMMVKHVLRLESLEIEVDVEPGKEDVWEMMKRDFNDETRKARRNGVDLGNIKVLIEPVMMDGGEDEFEL